MLQVAAYCRVSTDKEDQANSFEAQQRYFREYIQRQPDWELQGIYADEGFSGTSTNKRVEFNKMLHAAELGQIDLIVTKEVSRFTRNTVDALQITRELRRRGVGVLFLNDSLDTRTNDGELRLTIMSSFAQDESRRTSERSKWGQMRSMEKGVVFGGSLLGYDVIGGKMTVNPEGAEVVRLIFHKYLQERKGCSAIARELREAGILSSKGNCLWSSATVTKILKNEKYCGDVLLQKTFIRDCISKQVIRNTGQLPMYLIQNHHEAIISREQFDAVQMELARRRAQTGGTKKSAPTGMSRYSGKYALSGLLFCGECGTAYRRVVWTQHGEKRAVWRCSSRLDYGKKYCKESPTLDEAPLQQAVLAAINASMSGRKVLADQLVDAMEQELAPVPGESMSLGDIDRAVTELGKQFDMLLAEAANGDADEYAERFRAISTTMEELKRRKAAILGIRQEQEQISRRIHAAASAMTAVTMGITEWDDGVVYQMLEKVTVLADSRIKVTFRNGVEIEQTVDQPKRRKFI